MKAPASAVVALFLVLPGLVACGTTHEAMTDTVRAALKRSPGIDEAKLNPNLRYLRVTIGGRVALLALGYLDPHPHGTIEVWYSGDREVVRLQHGRLVGASGLTTEWRNVVLPELPAWSQLAESTTPLKWVRVRDVMPGYQYGVSDSLTLSVISPPAQSNLRGIEPSALTWFEERFAGDTPVKSALPAARYAVTLDGDGGTVVYAEQCIAPQTCFAWQRWPAGK